MLVKPPTVLRKMPSVSELLVISHGPSIRSGFAVGICTSCTESKSILIKKAHARRLIIMMSTRKPKRYWWDVVLGIGVAPDKRVHREVEHLMLISLAKTTLLGFWCSQAFSAVRASGLFCERNIVCLMDDPRLRCFLGYNHWRGVILLSFRL